MKAEDTKCHNPVFVIGSPRSGTTMLRLMLCSHKDIYIPPECGFAVWWYDKYKNWVLSDASKSKNVYGLANDIFSSRKFETWNISIEEIVDLIQSEMPDSYSEVVNLLYKLQAKKFGKTGARWGDKNNFYLNHIGRITTLFPDAQFVHIIRDARDVACSFNELAEKEMHSSYAPVLPGSSIESALSWNADIDTIRNSLKSIKNKNAVEVRYEDLVKRPELELTKICSVLEIEFDKNMLDFGKINFDDGLEPREFLQWKHKTLGPISEKSVGRYNEELESSAICQIEKECSKNLSIYGYISD